MDRLSGLRLDLSLDEMNGLGSSAFNLMDRSPVDPALVFILCWNK
jgi:hypothetical protein